MDINMTVISIIILVAIVAFATSEAALLSIWRSKDKKDNSESRNLNLKSARECYDDCMTKSHWDAVRISSCHATCKA